MRKSRYTDSQILAILKQNENGVPVPELWTTKTCLDVSKKTKPREGEALGSRLSITISA